MCPVVNVPADFFQMYHTVGSAAGDV